VATKEVRKNNYDVGRLLFQTIITDPDSSADGKLLAVAFDSLEGTTSVDTGGFGLSGLADVFS